MSISLNSAQDYWQVLRFPFQGRDAWKKIAVGALLSLLMFIIPVLPILVVCGYAVRIMKRILHQDGDPYLPEWDNWDVLLKDGLKVWGASLLIGLPLALLMLVSLGAIVVPWIILPVTAAESGHISDSATITAAILTVLGYLGLLLAIVLSWPLALVQGPILGHVVAQDSFQAAFRVKEWWKILRAGLGIFLLETVVVMVLAWLGSFIIYLSTLTILLCFLYPFLLATEMFFLTLYTYTFIALAYREARRRLLMQGQ